MLVINHNEIEKVFSVGDLHGEFKTFFNGLKQAIDVNATIANTSEKTNKRTRKGHQLYPNPLDSVIFVCGDNTLGWHKKKYYDDIFTKANTFLSEHNIIVYLIRGNHDDKSWYDNQVINFSNIKSIPDYTIVKTKNYTTLCVGGAISIDRTWRWDEEKRLNKYRTNKPKKIYWDDEAPILNEQILAECREQGIEIDSVVSHTCPSFSAPNVDNIINDKNNQWFKVDSKLRYDVMNERNIMTNLYEFLVKYKFHIKWWAYGHFHQFNITTKKEIIFILNDCNFHLNNIQNIIEQSRKTDKSTKGNVKADLGILADAINGLSLDNMVINYAQPHIQGIYMGHQEIQDAPPMEAREEAHGVRDAFDDLYEDLVNDPF